MGLNNNDIYEEFGEWLTSNPTILKKIKKSSVASTFHSGSDKEIPLSHWIALYPNGEIRCDADLERMFKGRAQKDVTHMRQLRFISPSTYKYCNHLLKELKKGIHYNRQTQIGQDKRSILWVAESRWSGTQWNIGVINLGAVHKFATENKENLAKTQRNHDAEFSIQPQK